MLHFPIAISLPIILARFQHSLCFHGWRFSTASIRPPMLPVSLFCKVTVYELVQHLNIPSEVYPFLLFAISADGNLTPSPVTFGVTLRFWHHICEGKPKVQDAFVSLMNASVTRCKLLLLSFGVSASLLRRWAPIVRVLR